MSGLATLLEETASRVPERPALLFDGRTISYGELAARAAAAEPDGPIVALPMPNVPGSVASFHGAVRRGAVVVPLSPLLSAREVAERARPFAPAPGTAVVLFTSGTTGEPKRVELTGALLRTNAEAIVASLGIREDDVLFGAAPLAHVFGLTGCMNGAIAAGAALALVPRFEAAAAIDTIEREAVTVFMGVPAMMSALLAASHETGRAPRLRLAHVGGAPLPPDVLHAFEDRFGAVVLEGYGMTEAGGAIAVCRADMPSKPGSVGRPVAGTEVRLAADGEVLVRVDGDWLSTGDVGLIDDEGDLFLLGRTKDVILRGGYTVHPREVEEALLEHPAVREAVVVGVPHPVLGEEVAALVVAAPGLDADALKAFARERVAAYKYPRLVVAVDALPRTPTGKVQRHELDRDLLARLLDGEG